MTEKCEQKPLVWLIDSQRSPLADCRDAITPWADVAYFAHDDNPPDWENPSGAFPDALFISAEIMGGPDGAAFRELRERAGNAPLVIVARLRSLAQAVAFFRAGAADYLSLPLDEDDARERAEAAFERAAALAMRGVMIEVEPVGDDTGEISLRLAAAPAVGGFPAPPPLPPPAIPGEKGEDEDILARLDPEPEQQPGAETKDGEDEPVAVDGLPIPTLWEELPCGVMAFDSNGNLVFSNTLAMGLFGYDSLAALQEALENRREDFKAHGANHAPLQDNQWPHILSAKTRTARSAVVSIVKPDRRRIWLRIDCLPHLHRGQMNRLSMTLVNLTGELPPLSLSAETAPPRPPASPERPGLGRKSGKAKRRGRRKK